jgi:hypothetical protein
MNDMQRLPPGELVRSFLLIAAAFVAIYLAFLAAIALLSRSFWPDAWVWLTTPNLGPERLRAEAAQKIAPGLFWCSTAVAAVVAFAAGWGVARLARFAGTAHAVFLAVAEFITMLQTVASAPGEVRWMPLTLLAVLPLAILAGARFAPAYTVEQEMAETE